MSCKCAVCGKALQRGNRISHAHNVSKRIWQPNLQRVRVVIDGRPCHARVCTRCLKKGLVQKKVRATAAPPTA
jgi:large subunit ribosomal protein L28